MDKRCFPRSGFLALIALMILVLVPAVLTWHVWRQEQLDHALLAAIEAGNTKQMQSNLRQGANPLSANYEQPPKSHLERMRDTLTNKQPKLKVIDSTALHLAVTNGDTSVVETLLQHGADIEALNKQDETVLQLAAEQSESPQMLQLLIAHGAKINRQDRDGNTSLMRAVEPGNIVNIRFLMAHGADVSIKNHYGLTALDLALRDDYKQPAIADLLQRAAKHP